MSRTERWRELMARVYAGRDDTQVAELSGLSQPWVNQIKNGRAPSREALALILDALEVGPVLRAEVFAETPFSDPSHGTDPFTAALEGIRQEAGADFQVSFEEMRLARGSPEERDRIIEAIRKRVMERARE